MMPKIMVMIIYIFPQTGTPHRPENLPMAYAGTKKLSLGEKS